MDVKFLQGNLELWNAWTQINADSAFYDLPGFMGGASSLNHVELEEVGDVRGKSLLHLQCHFGLDSLSWARLGAEVTGVDLADKAIDLAQRLASENQLNARFICCNLYDLPQHLNQSFDLVFTSYGVINWLNDLDKWAALIHRFLKPGGRFHMVEFHPFCNMLNDNADGFGYPYFTGSQPIEDEMVGNYADPNASLRSKSYEWLHGLGEVVSALAGAGLNVAHLHEFPYSVYNCFPFLSEEGPQRYVWRKGTGLQPPPGGLPLMYSIKAVKP